MFLETIWTPMDIGLIGFLATALLGCVAVVVCMTVYECKEKKARKKAEAKNSE